MASYAIEVSRSDNYVAIVGLLGRDVYDVQDDRATPLAAPLRFRAARCASVAVLAAAVALFFFTPRFCLFAGLRVPSARAVPEVNRAVDALAQLRHPFAPIENFSNLVLQWRLLFPLLGHALGLPDWAYLALPPLGCLFVLGFVAGLFGRRGASWWQMFCGVLLLATCSWFFVSTGWLAYFDSYYVLGLLLVAFSPARQIGAAAVLLTPWIDERFVVTIPLCLLVREAYFAEFNPRPERQRRQDLLWFGLCLLPWIAIRLGAHVLHGDRVTGVYATTMAGDKGHTLAASYAAGLWQGFRWAWVALLAAFVGTPRKNPLLTAALAIVGAITLIVQSLLAGDLSRSVSTLSPLLVLGILRLYQARGAAWRTLPTICALNLVFPAAHVFGNVRIPIFYFYTEWENAMHPPPDVSARDYELKGEIILANEGLDRAIDYLDSAIRIDPRFARAYASRAVAYYRTGRPREALADADQALALDPKFFEGYQLRAHLRADAGDLAGANTDLEFALRYAPNAWPSRRQAEADLQAIRSALTRASASAAPHSP